MSSSFFQYVPVEDTKIVEQPKLPLPDLEETAEEGRTAEQQQELDELNREKAQIIQDAQSFAEEQVRAAMDEVAVLKEQAQAEIELVARTPDAGRKRAAGKQRTRLSARL